MIGFFLWRRIVIFSVKKNEKLGGNVNEKKYLR